MKAIHTLCIIMLVMGILTISACTSTSRYVASSNDIQKFEKKEADQANRHKLTQK